MNNFAFNQTQVGRQTTKFSLTPKFIQIQKLLKAPAPDLIDYLHRQLDENPFLKESSPAKFLDEIAEKQPAHKKDSTEKLSNESISDNSRFNDLWNESFQSTPHKSTLTPPLNKSDIIEKTASNPNHSLTSDLLEQLAFIYNKNSEEFVIGTTIIGHLDQDGFFSPDLINTISQELPCKEKLLLSVLATIKNFEPTGIATSGLPECLILQLERWGQEEKKDVSTEIDIIKKNFDALIKKDTQSIKRRLKISDTKIAQSLENIRRLNPKPIRNYQSNPNSYLIPDATIIERDGQLEVIVQRELIPQIVYSKEKVKQWKEKNLNNNREFLAYTNKKSIEAKSLVEAIHFRETNLLKVLKKLIKVQADFFFHGVDKLQPYTLSKLATEINLDNGTLSRLVNRKYINTKWGMISLRTLFTSNIKQKNSKISSLKIKNLIRNLIKEFDDQKLSDQKITDILNKQGYEISRRTVNKYRNHIQVLSSFERNTI